MADTKLGHLSDVPFTPASSSGALRPELFRGKHEAQLGKRVGITQFGVNHLTLEPGSASALRHWHEEEDEFVYVLSGELVLVDDNGEHALRAGHFAGFPAGTPNAHHLVNRSNMPATFIAVGTRKVGRETIHYPDDRPEPAVIVRDTSGNRLPPAP